MGCTLYTVNQVAAMLDKAAVTVRKAARVHGIGSKAGRDHLFTATDVERLRVVIRDHSGRPAKVSHTPPP